MANPMSGPTLLAAEREKRQAEGAEQFGSEMIDSCRKALGELEGGAIGFALVVWGKAGDLHTVYRADEGPVGPALLPTLVSDALNRHIAVEIAKDGK